jgi:hypothetical protein
VVEGTNVANLIEFVDKCIAIVRVEESTEQRLDEFSLSALVQASQQKVS